MFVFSGLIGDCKGVAQSPVPMHTVHYVDESLGIGQRQQQGGRPSLSTERRILLMAAIAGAEHPLRHAN
jgi:hypothetical protein